MPMRRSPSFVRIPVCGAPSSSSSAPRSVAAPCPVRCPVSASGSDPRGRPLRRGRRRRGSEVGHPVDVVAEGVQEDDRAAVLVAVVVSAGVVVVVVVARACSRSNSASDGVGRDNRRGVARQPPLVLRPAGVQRRPPRRARQQQLRPPRQPLHGKRKQNSALGVDRPHRAQQQARDWVKQPQQRPCRGLPFAPRAGGLGEPAGAVEAEDLAEQGGEAGFEEAAEVVAGWKRKKSFFVVVVVEVEVERGKKTTPIELSL